MIFCCRRRDLLPAKYTQLKVQSYFLKHACIEDMRCLCFSLLMSKRCIIAWNDNEIFWKCCLLFAYSVCKDMQNRNNHNPIAWICAINQPKKKKSIKKSSNQRWQIINQQAIKRWIKTNKKLSNQAINQPVQQPSKQNRFTQRMSQQQHQASNFQYVFAAPSFAFSPCFPSDWSTFRVSLLK